MSDEPGNPGGGASQGPATDRQNNPVVDPTQNVLDLVEAAIRRQDDLRIAESRHIRDMAELRADHNQRMRDAEKERIDAIRAVDVSAVQQAAQVSATQATTLAAQVATSAETLRTQVAAAATAATVALAAALEPIQKDIADLRRAQYEAQGVKSNVGDQRGLYVAVFGALGFLLALVVAAFTIYAVVKP